MLRRPELPALSELPVFEDDPSLFDPSPEWFLPALKPSLREDVEEADGLGLRSLIEQPEVLSRAWQTTRRVRPSRRMRRAKPRPAGRAFHESDAA